MGGGEGDPGAPTINAKNINEIRECPSSTKKHRWCAPWEVVPEI
jgi:hypothetical protein